MSAPDLSEQARALFADGLAAGAVRTRLLVSQGDGAEDPATRAAVDSAIAASRPRRLKRFPLHERMAAGIPKPEVLVPGLMYAKGVHWFAGPPKSGKSFIARDAAIRVYQETGRPSLWLDHEAGWEQTGRAFLDMGASAAYVEQAIIYFATFRVCTDSTPDEVFGELGEQVAEYAAAAIFIDSVGKQLAALGLKENEAAEVTQWTAGTIIPAAKKLELAVAVIDHTARADEGSSGYARGSGEKLGAADVSWIVRKRRPFSVDGRGLIELHHRGNDRGGRLRSRLAFELGGQGENGSLQIEEVDSPPDGAEESPRIVLEEAIRQAGADGECQKREAIRDAVGAEENTTFERALKHAAKPCEGRRGYWRVPAASMDF